MEASKFGYGAGVAPAYKFDPTDEDIVAHYLLPRALNLPSPYAHAIIEDDPASLLPWDLLLKHGHGDSDHAFFFGPPGRRGRALNGGTWQGQQGVISVLTLVQEPGGGAELDITYKRYNLAFCTRGKRGETAGFVMHEYQIISPPLADTVLTRIRVTDKGKERMATLRRQQAEVEALHAAGDEQLAFPVAEQPAEADTVAAQMVLYDPDQPGPSCQYHPAVTVDGEEIHALYGGNDGGKVAGAAAGYYVHEAVGGGEGEYTNYCQYQLVDQLDPSYHYQYDAGNAAVTCDGEGFSGGQTGNGGGMGEATARGYEYDYASCEGGDDREYTNYCQYQSVDQLDPSYHYDAGNAAVTCDGEGFSSGQSGNGGGTGEATAGGYEYASSEGGGENNQYCDEFIADDGVNRG